MTIGDVTVSIAIKVCISRPLQMDLLDLHGKIVCFLFYIYLVEE